MHNSIDRAFVNMYADSLLNDLKVEGEMLSFTLSTIQAVIEDAETRQHTDKAIVVWLTRLKDIAYDAENVLKEWYELLSTQVTHSIPSGIDYKTFDFHLKIWEKIKNVQTDFDVITGEILKYDLKTSVVISLEQNLNVLSRLMVVLKHTKYLVAISGNWEMVTWLKNVRVRELQVDKIIEEFNKKTEEFSPNYLDAKDELNSELIESLTAIMVLIEEGKAGINRKSHIFNLDIFTLDKNLYKNSKSVEWERLYDIALGTARGIAYLHDRCNEQIIHRDVKAANVLLNKNLCSKITDVGVSNLMTNTRVRGTHGYAVPEILYKKPNSKLFSSEDLKKFTDFNKKLGSGGYSDVYQGEFQGEQVAVKVLKENDVVYETFLTERITMGRFSHTNLVKLYGFCFRDEIKALVYEYMEKGSFDNILYKNPYSVEWSQLYGIALEIARGLAYLHHDSVQIIHHDIKAANVLIGKNFCAKITDFGVSNLMRSDATHITNTRTRGTDCYAAPEVYRQFFPISCKCDVYSFGIMMFEIFGWRRCRIPIKGEIWFPEEVSKMWNEHPESVMEHYKIKENDRKKARIVLMVAMWCAQYTPTIRPSMREVVLVLEKEISVTTPPYPFHHHNPLGHSMLSEDDLNKFAESEAQALLELYEKKCPPGGENSVIIYTTTFKRMRKLFEESNDVCAVLRSHQIIMIERDVWGDVDYEDELDNVMGKIQIPVLFVKGRLIGGADEVKRLEAEGKLKVLLYGIPTEYSEAKKSPERMLQLFKEMCPPGGENTVVLYTTTIGRMKRRFEESNEVRAILESHDIEMIERDVWGDDVDYEDELIDLLGKMQIPVLFVKGRLIGAADEVKRLEASGELKVLLYGL